MFFPAQILASAFSDAVTSGASGLSSDIVTGLVAGIAVGVAFFGGKIVWRSIKSVSDSLGYESRLQEVASEKLTDLAYPAGSVDLDASRLVQALKWESGGTFDAASHAESVRTIDNLQAWAASPRYTSHGVFERQADYDSAVADGFSHSTAIDIMNGDASRNDSGYGFSYASYPGGRDVYAHNNVTIDEARESRASMKLAERTV